MVKVTSPSFSNNKVLREELKAIFPEAVFSNRNNRYTKEELIGFIKYSDGIIVGLDQIDSDVIDECQNLKIIAKYGVGLDNIDIDYCKKKGIKISPENIHSLAGRGEFLQPLLGIEDADTKEDIEWLSAKISKLRIFSDDDGKMNLSINEVDGEIIVVSQFTLHASIKKGNRPSFITAANPEKALEIYTQFVKQLAKQVKKPIQTGEFGTYMNVNLVNDGPVTIFIDSKNKE